MRVDHASRKLSCSVNDLIWQSTYRRIGVERGDGFRRMWIGQDVHLRRAAERADVDPNYRAEVFVDYKTTIGEWEVHVSGRIDGLSVDREHGFAVVEEVKSIHFDLELAGLSRSEKLQRFLYQLMLYCWFYSMREESADLSVRAQLVLIDVLGDRTKVIDAPFVPEEIASAFEASIGALVADLESEMALRVVKRAFAESVPFPYARMRPFQSEMIEAVERAVQQRETLLVSAPTGVGKTIAAIYPSLRESLRSGKKLFYLTSKTLQQEIAVEAFRLLNDGSFRVLRIRNKRKMCAHTEVICHEDFCPYAAGYSEKKERTGLKDRLVAEMSYFDPDITFEVAKSNEVCPFEVSLELIDEADVIICDYNYVFDPWIGLRSTREEMDWDDCVLVVDEAHNLVDRARGYFSPEIRDSSFEKIRQHLYARSFDSGEWVPLLAALEDHCRELAEVLSPNGGTMQIMDGAPAWELSTPAASSEIWPPAWGATGGRSFDPVSNEVKQALCTFSRRFFARQRAGWETIIVQYITWKIEQRIAEENDPLMEFYFSLVRFATMVREESEEFAHIIERGPDGIVLRVLCLDPSRFLGEVFSSAHATIAISATLEPFDFHRQTLGFPTSRASELSLPSPFPRENRKIVVVPDVDTSWKKRSEHFGTIADLVAELGESTRGNFLALFPSYAFLREVHERLPYVSMEVLVQRSDMTDWERRSLLESMRSAGREGTLLLAVSGGMYAEGIDYPGDMLSGVAVVGPALPAVSFDRELLKRYYDEQYGLGFEYAYLIPGMTRVIQSAGRVIRSEFDVGVIALLCRRFTLERYNRYFPADWYERSPRELVVKKTAGAAVRLFFEERGSPLPGGERGQG